MGFKSWDALLIIKMDNIPLSLLIGIKGKEPC
jgi:hypothetical protein